MNPPARSIFDHIIAGALPASFVCRDAHCVAFMDINPVSRGHVLVVPVQSVATLEELDPQVLPRLWQVAVRIGAAQRAGLGSLAQHFLVNDGKDASQSVPHVHIHVIPRYPGDTARTLRRMIWHLATLKLRRGARPALREELDGTAAAIRRALEAA